MTHEPRIRAICEEVVGPTVLDLGAVQHDAIAAGSDEWLHKRLTQLAGVERVVGVDILDSDVQTLQDQGYEMVAANVEAMDIDVTANTVVAGELIEHVDRPGDMLERAKEHLAPGGRLVLSTPNPWAVVHLRRWLQRDPHINEEHVAWYGPVVLSQLLERHGFTVQTMRTVGPDHGGLTAWAKRLGYDVFGGTTWVCAAKLVEGV